jgi:TPR repeat protein
MGRYEMAGAELAPLAETKPNAEAFFELGIFYATGREMAADLVAAHKWFNLAAINGNPEAALHRQQIAGEMSAREIADAQRAAREWLRLH